MFVYHMQTSLHQDVNEDDNRHAYLINSIKLGVYD